MGDAPDDMASWVEITGGKAVSGGPGAAADWAGKGEEALVRKVIEWLDGPDGWWTVYRQVQAELAQKTTLDFEHLFQHYPQVGFVLHRGRPDVRNLLASALMGKPARSPLHQEWCRQFDAHSQPDRVFGMVFEWVGVERQVCMHNAVTRPNPRDIRFSYPARFEAAEVIMTVEPLPQFLEDQFGPPFAVRTGHVDEAVAAEKAIRRRGARLRPRRDT